MMMLTTKREVDLATIALVAGTRLAIGVGVGLLLARRLSPESRRAAGWALVAVGAATTIPLVADVLASETPASSDRQQRNRTDREPAYAG